MKKSITFKRWLEKRKEKVRPTSKKTYQSYVQKHLLPFFEFVLLEKITSKNIKGFKKYLKKKGLAAKTIRDILSYLGKILKDAERAGYITCSQIPQVKTRGTEHVVLSLKEQKRLSEKLRENENSRDMAVWLAMNTGLRLGEVLGLSQKDIDLEAGVLHVKKNLQRIPKKCGGGTELKLLPPKSKKSRRDIPLNEKIKETLRIYLHAQKENPNAPLFVDKKGMVLDPRTLQLHFARLKEKYALNKKLTFHSLRHSFATRSMELGVEPRALSELLGHSSVTFTLECYGRCVNEHKRRQMEKLTFIA